jgi:tryptophanyl-tRNA synthetase
VPNAGAATQMPTGRHILSGVQPSGSLHIGNYFGAIRQFVALQQGNDCVYCLVDYHSMTTLRDGAERRRQTFDLAVDFLALGIDPETSILYRQSELPEVHELAWCLSTVTPVGLLQRAHSYKDKVAHGVPADHGLFAYPVLMAADILIHRADLVPVGQDQKQHVEITRDITLKFNSIYGDVLTLPELYILEDVAVVPGIDGQKMSKSYDNAIEMFAKEKQLKSQVMGIVTDSTPVEEPKDINLPLFQLYNLFADAEEREEMARRASAGGLGYGEAKKALLAKLLAHFTPARERRAELAAHPDTVEDILADGARRARERGAPLVAAVREATGLGSGK